MRTYIQFAYLCSFVWMGIVSRGRRKGLDPRIHSVAWRDCNKWRPDVTGLTVPGAIWRTVNGKRPSGCNVISKSLFRAIGVDGSYKSVETADGKGRQHYLQLPELTRFNMCIQSSISKSRLIFSNWHLIARNKFRFLYD